MHSTETYKFVLAVVISSIAGSTRSHDVQIWQCMFKLCFLLLPGFPRAYLKIAHHGLHTLSNLQELDLRSNYTGLGAEDAQLLLRSSFEFRLKRFRNAIFDLKDILVFLESQPSILLWEQTIASPCELAHDILPNLQSIHSSMWVIGKLRPSQAIRHVTTPIICGRDNELQIIQLLGKFQTTMGSLNLHRDVSDESLLLEHLVIQLEKNLPHLTYLAIDHVGATVSVIKFLSRQNHAH